MKAIPGTALGYKPSDGYTSGTGTFVRDDMIYASKLGSVNVIKTDVSIGSVVDVKMKLFLGRIVKINATKAIITIFINDQQKINDHPKFSVDLILLAKDSGKENLLQYFKLGDTLQIRLLSNLYDENVYCTTIGNDVGVVLANCSECFSKLSIVSPDCMFCSNCKNIEKRKCFTA